MEYVKFQINQYKGIKGPLELDISKNRLIPLVGINECGKTTILKSILCFDYINDSVDEGRHLERLQNLYSAKTGEKPRISAFIKTDKKEFLDFITQTKEDQKALAICDETYQTIQELSDFEEIIIERDLTTKKYNINVLETLKLESQDLIAKELIRSELPYILYNDDFNDRPENSIEINSTKKSEWLEIYERVFETAGYDLYDVFNETNEEKRETIIEKVVFELNKNLTNTWNKFKLRTMFSKLKIKLKINVDKKRLLVNVVEEKSEQNYHFKVDDRSKGFIWYYNFTMKLMYNPKFIGREERTIFLLDEPGSYLHASAQETLCQKLKEISKKNGIVIYCTHSHHMLNPNHVPLNNIMIVQKETKNLITLEKATQIKTEVIKNKAFQPIYEALQLPFYKTLLENEKVVLVEGIYDKYAIELFCNLDDNIMIFPSTSCEDIIKNIPYFILYNIDYMVVWDNDYAGRTSRDKAKVLFAEENNKFQVLQNKNNLDRRMEEMFENNDIQTLRDKLKLSQDASYETVLSTLYYSKYKKNAKDLISDETIKNFQILNGIINKTINSNKQGR